MGERTFGPWTAYHDYKTTWGIKNSVDEPICDRLDEACARFIAAAPDMEEALEGLLSEHCGNHECDDIVHDLARTALAKAKVE